MTASLRIEPKQSRASIQIRELWEYRELLYLLTWRDIKVRYKQTALGAAWAILQPLLAMAVFSFDGSQLMRFGSTCTEPNSITVVPWARAKSRATAGSSAGSRGATK